MYSLDLLAGCPKQIKSNHEINHANTLYSMNLNDNAAVSAATKTPLFKTLSNDALRAEYRGWRALAYNNAGAAASGAVNLSRAAGQMGRIMRNVNIIEAIARQRRISLA